MRLYLNLMIFIIFLSTVSATTTNITAPVVPKTITIPSELSILSTVFLGVPAGTVMTFEYLVIALVLWILLFVIISSLLMLVPFFEKKAFRFIAAFIVVALMNVSGGIKEGINYINSLFSLISFFQQHPVLQSILQVLLFLLFTILVMYFVRTAKQSARISSATTSGVRLGSGMP